MVLHVSRLLRVTPESPQPKINLVFRMENNKVHPTSFLHTCFIYKNGDAILDMGAISWKYNDVCVDFMVDCNHADVSEISTVLVSPSDGDWIVPNILITDESGKSTEFVATNVEGNCMYMVPEPPVPPSPERVQKGLQEYSDTKQRIIKLHASLVGMSAFIMHSMQPSDDTYTKWFALGGIVGLMYQFLIQYEIDQIGNEHKGIIYPLLANSFFRLTMISSAFLFTTMSTSTANLDTSVFIAILGGFMMNKVAMYITFWTQKNESSLKE